MAETTAKERKEISILDVYGRNLTRLARENRLTPIYGINQYIESILSLLSFENTNILLVGEPGVGKNAVVEGLAKWVERKRRYLPASITNCNIYEMSVISFQTNCSFIHEFETRIKNIVDSCIESNSILFFDNINMAIDAGKTAQSGERNLANLLSPYLSRSELRLIGATTTDGYEMMLRANPSFTGRFSVLEIQPTDKWQTARILFKLKRVFEEKYGVSILNAAIKEIISYCDRYYRWKMFPGKAFELLYEIIADRKSKIHSKTILYDKTESDNPVIGDIDVLQHVMRKTGLPENIIVPSKKLDKAEIRAFFKNRVLGQDHAIESLIDTIITFKAGLNDPGKPLGSFLFVGPTGVGKTHLAKALAEYLFGDSGKMLRYDMSEYNLSGSVEKLIGGYVDRGQLIEDVLIHPFSVLLFDEIEKAHPEIYNLLLQVLGEGRLTDRWGRTAYFNNSIIIMTSNLGSELYTKEKIGIYRDNSDDEDLSKDIIKFVENYFRPEFINRLTEIIVFKRLSGEILSEIAKKEIQLLLRRDGIKRIGIKVHYTNEVLDLIASEGYSEKYGARPMKRAIEKHIGISLAELISNLSIKMDDHLLINVVGEDRISVTIRE